jgi:signal transduction histidine kinase
MRLQTKITASVGVLIGLASVAVSSVSILTSLDQNIRQLDQNLESLGQVILASEDPISTALFEGSTREITALYIDEFGVETYLQENAGELGLGNQLIQELALPNSESITLAVSTDDAIAGASSAVVPVALITMLVILLATAVTHFLLKRDISAINKLIQQAKSISQGGERKLASLKGSWEVETLTDSLATMIQSLDNNEKALQKFLSDASHELKTPLTVVRGYLDILSQPNVAIEVRQSAEKALRQSIRMQKIIDDLLALAEIRGTEVRKDQLVDLSGLVSDALEDLANLKSEHVLETNIQEQVFLLGSPDQLERLISNLVGNINAHVPAGSKVVVTLTEQESRIRLTVEDSGPGFPDGIFNEEGRPVRFRKGDSGKSGSTGLGMSMIFEVVDNHRGTIEVGTSQLGGAKISITLPSLAS